MVAKAHIEPAGRLWTLYISTYLYFLNPTYKTLGFSKLHKDTSTCYTRTAQSIYTRNQLWNWKNLPQCREIQSTRRCTSYNMTSSGRFGEQYQEFFVSDRSLLHCTLQWGFPYIVYSPWIWTSAHQKHKIKMITTRGWKVVTLLLMPILQLVDCRIFSVCKGHPGVFINMHNVKDSGLCTRS